MAAGPMHGAIFQSAKQLPRAGRACSAGNETLICGGEAAAAKPCFSVAAISRVPDPRGTHTAGTESMGRSASRTAEKSVGKAVNYTRQRWNRLCRYTHNGLVENLIRPIALGRKNYLCAGSHAGARNLAVFYSLIPTSPFWICTLYFNMYQKDIPPPFLALQI